MDINKSDYISTYSTAGKQVVITYVFMVADVITPQADAETTIEQGVEFAKSDERVDEILDDMAAGMRDYLVTHSVTVIDSGNLGPSSESEDEDESGSVE